MSSVLRYLQHTPSPSPPPPNSAAVTHALNLLPVPPLPTFTPSLPRPIPRRVPIEPLRTSTTSLTSITEEASTPNGLYHGTPTPNPLLARDTYTPIGHVPRCRLRAPIRVSRAKEEGEKSREEVIQELVEECRKNPGAWMKGFGVEESIKARCRMSEEDDVLVLLRRERGRKRYGFGKGPSYSGRRGGGKVGMKGGEVNRTKEEMKKDEEKWKGRTCGVCERQTFGIVCYICEANTPATTTSAARAHMVIRESRRFPLVKKAPEGLACGGAVVMGRCSVDALGASSAATQSSLSRGSINARRARPSRFKKPCQTRRREILGREYLDCKENISVDTKVVLSSDLRDGASSSARGEWKVAEDLKDPSKNQSVQQSDEAPMPRESDDTPHLALDLAATATYDPCDEDASTGQRCASVGEEPHPSGPDRKRSISQGKFTGLPVKLEGGYFLEHLDESAVGEVLRALLADQEAAVRAGRERFFSNETTAVVTPKKPAFHRVRSVCRKLAQRTIVAMRSSDVDLEVNKEAEESDLEGSEPLDPLILSRELTRELERQSITPQTECWPCGRQEKSGKPKKQKRKTRI